MMRKALISFPMFGDDFILNPPSSINIGNFSIYFYGIIIAVGFLLAIWYTSKNCRRFDIDMDSVYDYLIWGVIAGVVCARLYYVVFYFSWADIKADPVSVLRIRDGGLAIYGGVIGAVAALLIRARMRREKPWPILDILGFGLLIGQLVGRWGNFFNREAFGYETDIFCRMGLTLGGQTMYVHPTFLYESLWNLLGLILLHFHSRKHRRWQGQYFFYYVFWYGLGRMFIEGLRTDSLWLIPNVIRVSQLLAGLSMVLAFLVILINEKRLLRGKKPFLGGALDGDDIIIEEAEEAQAPSEAAEAEENGSPAPEQTTDSADPVPDGEED